MKLSLLYESNQEIQKLIRVIDSMEIDYTLLDPPNDHLNIASDYSKLIVRAVTKYFPNLSIVKEPSMIKLNRINDEGEVKEFLNIAVDPLKNKKTKTKTPPKIKPKNKFKERFGDLKLSRYPPDDMLESDVRVNLTGDIHTHAVLSWRVYGPRMGRGGKVQGGYTPEFIRRGQEKKENKIIEIEPNIDNFSILNSPRMEEIQLTISSELSRAEKNSITESALAIALIIASTALRAGTRGEFAKTNNRGVSTLAPNNVTIDEDNITIFFRGKKDQPNKATIINPMLADILLRLKEEAKTEGRRFLFKTTSATALNKLRSITGIKNLNLKDLRTMLACQWAKKAINELTPIALDPQNPKATKRKILNAIKEVSIIVSDKLNNTPEEARDSYIHPNIFTGWIASIGGDIYMKEPESETIADEFYRFNDRLKLLLEQELLDSGKMKILYEAKPAYTMDLNQYKTNASPKWVEILNRFPEPLQREIIDERSGGDKLDIQELTTWQLSNRTPIKMPILNLLKNKGNIDHIAKSPRGVVDQINKNWNLKVVPGKVYDQTPGRYQEYANMSAETAGPSIMVNGEIYWGVGRFKAALLRKDKTLKVWDIRSA